MTRRSLGILAALAALPACGGDDLPTLDVLAASSFTDVAGPLETLVEAELAVDVRFSFGSSGSFFEQMNQGAPAGVVITANTETMRRMEAAGFVDAAVPIATNRLVVVTADTAAGRRIGSLADLSDSGAVIVLCASSAPCGAASDEVLTRAGVEVDPASREPNVRATLTKVVLGEADAALVYRTDAVARPELRSIPVGADIDVVVTAWAAAAVGDDRAREAVAVLTGRRARAALEAAGFDAP